MAAFSTPSFSGFGSSVGSAPAVQGNAFSFGVNTAKTTASTGFNFGAPSNTVAPSAFGGMGTSGFSFGGGAAPSTSTMGFSFGGPTTTTASTGFGFGTTPATTAASSGFGGFGGFGTSAFGTAPTATSAPFGTSTFGAPATSAPATSTGFNFGGFGTGGFGGSAFGGVKPFGAPTSTQIGGQTIAQSQPQTFLAEAAALFRPTVFGDERDVILAKWNRLLAFWGNGKAYYANGAPPYEFTPQNPFCRFKALGYSCLPKSRNEDGLVALILNKKETDVRPQQQQIVDGLHRIMGSQPTLSVCVEGLKPVAENRSEITMYILERSPNGMTRRIPSLDVYTFLNQSNICPVLTSLGIDAVVPKVAPTKEQLKQYLEYPPAGIDPLLWQQAQLDNPDPENIIPVPLVGFGELQKRLKCQEEESRVHQGRLNAIATEISDLQTRHATALAQIAECKRKYLELSRRLLQVMVRQEITRKLGQAIQPDEEQLRIKLETLQSELLAPNQFKGRLDELLSQSRMQRDQMVPRAEEGFVLDADLSEEIKLHLKRQQEGLTHLLNIIKEDLDELHIIEAGLKDELHSNYVLRPS